MEDQHQSMIRAHEEQVAKACSVSANKPRSDIGGDFHCSSKKRLAEENNEDTTTSACIASKTSRTITTSTTTIAIPSTSTMRGVANLPPLPALSAFPSHIRTGQTVIGVGKNYAKHAAEMWDQYERHLSKSQGMTGPPRPEASPILFQKPRTSFVFDSPIQYAKSKGVVHYEAEVAILIGKEAYRVKREDALDYIMGFTVGLDMTAREPQMAAKENGHPWCPAKSGPHFLPFAKDFIAIDQILKGGATASSTGSTTRFFKSGLPHAEIELECKINGELRQKATTRELVYDVPFLLEEITKTWPLVPGDVIMTGTPEGVGPVLHGDHFEMSISVPTSAGGDQPEPSNDATTCSLTATFSAEILHDL
ncbi:unnamed protein product [Amoebophrya sp. A25]|nr:unnamed protein product [Amoebophrya sp. A25]|eukprot:GSA25T00000206001.1